MNESRTIWQVLLERLKAHLRNNFAYLNSQNYIFQNSRAEDGGAGEGAGGGARQIPNSSSLATYSNLP